MRKRSLPIRWQLAAVSLLAVGPLLLLGSFFIDRLARIDRVQVEDAARQVARQTADLLDRELLSIKTAMQTLQTSPALHTDDIDGFTQQAHAVLGSFPGALISLRNGKGEIVTSTLPSGREIQPRLASAEIRALDQRALSEKRALVSNLYTGVISQRLFASIATPVFREGLPPLVLNLTLTTERMLDVVSLVSVDPSWIVAVVDGNYRIIARTRDQAKFAGTSATPLYQRNTSGRRGLFDGITLEGEPSLTAYERTAGADWIVSASVPRSSLEMPLRQSQYIIVGLSVVALLLSAILALSYGYYIAAPIRQLRSDAETLGAGHEVAAFRTGINELDHVSNSLQQASVDLRQRERQQRLLINELNHRVKNTLAVIQSLVRRTARSAGSVEDLEKALEGRLLALAASHDALTASSWQGADLRRLVENATRIFSHSGDRVIVSGTDLSLSNRGSVAMSMMLHELSTNAVKYGALSVPAGLVRVAWTDEGERVRFRWTEEGGPAVGQPTRTGFGTALIRACVTHDLDGECSFHYDGHFAFDAILPKSAALHRPDETEFHG